MPDSNCSPKPQTCQEVKITLNLTTFCTLSGLIKNPDKISFVLQFQI